jgi:hypothetical protein
MKNGYILDTCGFTWPFSWWRATNEPWGRWSVLGHGPFTRDGRAVVDDFGTLVEVKT